MTRPYECQQLLLSPDVHEINFHGQARIVVLEGPADSCHCRKTCHNDNVRLTLSRNCLLLLTLEAVIRIAEGHGSEVL